MLLAGGALLGVDMTLWAESVRSVGAGVSTVVVNVQVVILPLLAFLVLGERVRRTFVLAVPVMLVGVALAGGLIGGEDAVSGAVELAPEFAQQCGFPGAGVAGEQHEGLVVLDQRLVQALLGAQEVAEGVGRAVHERSGSWGGFGGVSPRSAAIWRARSLR